MIDKNYIVTVRRGDQRERFRARHLATNRPGDGSEWFLLQPLTKNLLVNPHTEPLWFEWEAITRMEPLD